MEQGRLTECSCKTGSVQTVFGFYTSINSCTVRCFLADGKQQISSRTVRESGPAFVRTGIPQQDVLSAVQALTDREALTALAAFKPDLRQLAARTDSTYITLTFDDSACGGESAVSLVIDAGAAAEADSSGILAKIRSLLEDGMEHAEILSSGSENDSSFLNMSQMQAMMPPPPPQPEAVPQAAPSGVWQCRCGTTGNTGRFCPECGAARTI